MILDMTQYIELQKPDSTLNYLNNQLESVFLKVTRDEILRDLQVYVTSYAQDRDTIEKLKSLMQPAIQNGADLADMADMLTANSERSLREILKKVQERNQEAKQQEMQLKQQQLQQQQQQFEMQLQVQEQKRLQDMENENMNKELDRQNRLMVEQLKGIANEGSYSPTLDTTDFLTEQTKLAVDQSRLEFEKQARKRELDQNERKLDIEEKKAKDALDIAKLRDKGTLNPKPKKNK
jgi:hypothetical protein